MATPTAVFPGAVATDSQLKIANNLIQTTLKVGIDASNTILFVSSTAGFTANCLVSIEKEIIAIASVVSTPNPQLIAASGGRGFDGTTAVAHGAGAKVSMFIDAWHHNALSSEIKAIETALGPNLANVAADPRLISTKFIFTPQAPGGALTAGVANVITLSPVPAGVNGNDTNHYLYISGGTGTAEPVLIAGGTAVSGAASGTVIVTPANAHSGAWTIQSATAGIQEAINTGVAQVYSRFAIYIPQGWHNIYGPIYLPAAAYACINGAGAGVTMLKIYPTSGNIIFLEGNSEAVLDFGCFGMTKSGVGASGTETDLYIKNWSPNTYIHDLNIDRCYNGIVTESAQCILQRVNISLFANIGLRGFGTRVGGYWRNLTVANNIDSGAGSDAPYAVKIEGTVDGLNCTDCAFGGTDYAFAVNPGATYASNFFFVNCYFERYKLQGYFHQQDPASSGAGLIKIDNCRFLSRNTDAAMGIMLVSNGGSIKIDAVTISNNYIAMNLIGVRLSGVANATISGNTIYGSDFTSYPTPQEGIVFDSVSGGTPSKDVAITGNMIGWGLFGSTTRGNQDFVGGPAETAIEVDAATHQNITVVGNVLHGITQPLLLRGLPASLVVRDNAGLDDINYITIASAATVNFQVTASGTAYPFFYLSGNVAVTAVAGLWESAKGVFIATHAAPAAWTAGATIGNTFTPQSNVPVYWEFRSGKIWLK
jgi:hypothetical protein